MLDKCFLLLIGGSVSLATADFFGVFKTDGAIAGRYELHP
jgi:hypothetical protein